MILRFILFLMFIFSAIPPEREGEYSKAEVRLNLTRSVDYIYKISPSELAMSKVAGILQVAMVNEQYAGTRKRYPGSQLYS